ncbi:caspase family protein [Rhodopseudomonas palustris]|uniref:caspase family protein n=1 Tax=Rhodopseudomonas palustris TaxID=1076 RepID=UPI0021F27288|nr:caspase family protein [Rhodopseudomonas palustris]UYO54604.1 caspase family protein [Rhodopseudomonas palustris]
MQESPILKRRRLAPIIFCFTVFGLFNLSGSRAEAETYAVVVGINDYLNLNKLKGAVDDAHDISGALTKSGVRDVVTLIDAEATRKSVLGAIDRMITKVHKDDLAIITFAGHGGREDWGRVHPPGTKTGDPHEVFLLRNVTLPNAEGNIDPKLKGSASERIFGGEIALRLKRLDDRGVRTIFVADTCHGGGLTREPSLKMSSDDTRYQKYVAFAEGADPLVAEISGMSAPIDTDKELHKLSFLAAVDRVHKSPEIEIPKGSGRKRGALSYAFARVIEGKALTSGRRDLTHGDLLSYVVAAVKTNALDNGRGQEPDLRPRDNFDRVVIRFGADLQTSATTPPIAQVESGIRIFSQSGKPVDAVSRPDRGFAIRPVTELADADIIYDPVKGDVFSKGGDLIAMHVMPVDLEGVAEQQVAMRRLVELAKSHARALRLNQGDRRYLEGEELRLDARRPPGEPVSAEYYVLLIISGNGKMQFQYPRDGDPKMLPTDRPLGKMAAGEPFGADYAVFVSDDRPLNDLVEALRKLDGKTTPNVAVGLIERSLTPNMRIGLQGMYTVPKPK